MPVSTGPSAAEGQGGRQPCGTQHTVVVLAVAGCGSAPRFLQRVGCA